MISPSYTSIVQCAAQTGIPSQEIRRAKRSGQCADAFKSHRVILLPLIRWLYGEGRKKSIHIVDVAAAKEADLLESAALKKQKRFEKEGQLVPKGMVDNVIREVMLPVRQRLFAMPSECAHLANPADPPHARKVLESWNETNLPIMMAGNLAENCPYCGAKKKETKQESSETETK